MNSACAPATTRSYEINIAEGDGHLLSRVPQDSLSIRAGLIVVAITASCGLAWIVMSSLTSPSDLAWVGESKEFSVLPALLRARLAKLSTLRPLLPIPKVVFGQSGGRFLRWAGRPVRGTVLSTILRQRAAARNHPWRCSAKPIHNRHSPALQQHTASIRLSANDLNSRVKLTPIPETRPTTIEGWTLREVTNGIAIVEGPNGIWRVRRGDTVPGVGRIDLFFSGASVG